jgi:hypothetical protein
MGKPRPLALLVFFWKIRVIIYDWLGVYESGMEVDRDMT